MLTYLQQIRSHITSFSNNKNLNIKNKTTHTRINGLINLNLTLKIRKPHLEKHHNNEARENKNSKKKPRKKIEEKLQYLNWQKGSTFPWRDLEKLSENQLTKKECRCVCGLSVCIARMKGKWKAKARSNLVFSWLIVAFAKIAFLFLYFFSFSFLWKK